MAMTLAKRTKQLYNKNKIEQKRFGELRHSAKELKTIPKFQSNKKSVLKKLTF